MEEKKPVIISEDARQHLKMLNKSHDSLFPYKVTVTDKNGTTGKRFESLEEAQDAYDSAEGIKLFQDFSQEPVRIRGYKHVIL